MSDVTAGYGIPFDFTAIFKNFDKHFMPDVLFLHQNFIDCVSD